MDTERQLRFAVAPFFAYASLVIGAIWGGVLTQQSLAGVEKETLLAIAGALLASTLPLGFLLGAVSINALRLMFRTRGKQSYEVVLKCETWNRIWPVLDSTLEFDDKHTLYAAVVFDHEVMSVGVHEWIMRRWTAFSISLHSCTALITAFALGLWLGVPFTVRWGVATAVCVLLLGFNALVAWRQTMQMFDFQSHRQRKAHERSHEQDS